MAYHFVRQPLRVEDADNLSNSCKTIEEKLLVWTLLDTGLRISELCGLTSNNIMWQQKAIRVFGKGGPYGKMSKKRIVPMTRRIQSLLEHYFSLHDKWFMSVRVSQYKIKEIANRAKIADPVTCHVLRHTFATLALQKGISLASLSRILGHDRLETTAIYLNLTPGMVCEEFYQKW